MSSNAYRLPRQLQLIRDIVTFIDKQHHDFISTQTVSSGRRIHYNDARFLAHPESFGRRETYDGNLRGSPALSAFRINKLLARLQAANSGKRHMPNIHLPI
ncbi:hypothetical protein MJ563_20555 [Klebsiella pneumoniae]|nr:hypothetical protein MJ563_20555 [Klebsiella pneumoniae]